MALIRWIVGFIIAAAITAFAVSNRHSVEFFWTPLHAPLELPLYIVALLLTGFGFVLGCFMVWLNDGSLRRERRRQKREIKTLEKELKSTQETRHKNTPPDDFFPALPKKAKP